MSDDFEALPRALQIQVDGAFDAALDSKPQIRSSRRKRNKLPTTLVSGGGFIVESGDTPGGFILRDDNDGIEQPYDDLIPFSLIPTALQILDLPPDDEDVLQVFRNAAGGWSNVAGPHVTGDAEEDGGAVSRKDWHAVCAAILGHERDSETEENGGFMIDESATTSGAEGSAHEEVNDDADNDDPYQESSLSSLSSEQGVDSDSDEYLEEPSGAKSKFKPSGRKSRRTTECVSPGTPTPRQKRAALDAFALFFPSLPPLSDTELATKRLMFKDIVRVAETLKERIKAEEVTEMLCLFSTSPDKSMKLDDFTRMMIMAKLA